MEYRYQVTFASGTVKDIFARDINTARRWAAKYGKTRNVKRRRDTDYQELIPGLYLEDCTILPAWVGTPTGYAPRPQY